ncbi:MAG: hypothetical protein PHX21_12995 [bacterium]|nr:hypothetical protein [bacterium]
MKKGLGEYKTELWLYNNKMRESFEHPVTIREWSEDGNSSNLVTYKNGKAIKYVSEMRNRKLVAKAVGNLPSNNLLFSKEALIQFLFDESSHEQWKTLQSLLGFSGLDLGKFNPQEVKRRLVKWSQGEIKQFIIKNGYSKAFELYFNKDINTIKTSVGKAVTQLYPKMTTAMKESLLKMEAKKYPTLGHLTQAIRELSALYSQDYPKLRHNFYKKWGKYDEQDIQFFSEGLNDNQKSLLLALSGGSDILWNYNISKNLPQIYNAAKKEKIAFDKKFPFKKKYKSQSAENFFVGKAITDRQFFIYKHDGKTTYVETVRPYRGSSPKPSNQPSAIFVTTRTPYLNTMFGQMEQSGWADRNQLIPLRSSKIINTLISAEKSGKERSKDMSKIFRGRGLGNTPVGKVIIRKRVLSAKEIRNLDDKIKSSDSVASFASKLTDKEEEYFMTKNERYIPAKYLEVRTDPMLHRKHYPSDYVVDIRTGKFVANINTGKEREEFATTGYSIPYVWDYESVTKFYNTHKKMLAKRLGRSSKLAQRNQDEYFRTHPQYEPKGYKYTSLGKSIHRSNKIKICSFNARTTPNYRLIGLKMQNAIHHWEDKNIKDADMYRRQAAKIVCYKLGRGGTAPFIKQYSHTNGLIMLAPKSWDKEWIAEAKKEIKSMMGLSRTANVDKRAN